jgi:hypothetical protein
MRSRFSQGMLSEPDLDNRSLLDNILSDAVEPCLPQSLDPAQPSLDVATVQQHNNGLGDSLPSELDMAAGFDSGFHNGLQMLFDSSNNTQGLSHELDWLFGTISPEQDGSYDMSTHGPDVAPEPSDSPSSTRSHLLSSGALDGHDNVWNEVRDKIMLVLAPLSSELAGNSFFEPRNLEKFYHLYFVNYNTHFPILHQPTFSCHDSSPLLLLAILALGATLSDKEHYEASEAIHDKLRWLIFSVGMPYPKSGLPGLIKGHQSEGFQPPAPLWCLQALLIVQAHGKMFSSRKHHEMAHIFHGAIITVCVVVP